jgi:ferritin
MTIKDTIKSMVITYPVLFPTKLELYNHLFLTNGNGYEWIDGELVSEGDIKDVSIEDGLDKLFNDQFQYVLLNDYLKVVSKEEFIINLCKQKNEDPIVNYFKRKNEEKLTLVKRIINYKNITNEKLYVTDEVILYPLCEYSQILNVPDDIKDDWKDAIKEFLDFIMTSEDNKIVSYRNQYIHELSEVQYKLL